MNGTVDDGNETRLMKAAQRIPANRLGACFQRKAFLIGREVLQCPGGSLVALFSPDSRHDHIGIRIPVI